MSKRRRRDGSRASFAAPSTASAPPLSGDMMRMLATAANDITIPNYGNVLRSQDETILARGGGRGIRLYDEVRRDGHALSVLSKRISKVLAREWIVTPASDAPRDEEAADLVREVLSAMPFDVLCRGLLWAALYGYSIAEVEWGRRDGRVVPAQLAVHERARFVFDLDWRPRLLTLSSASEGIELPERKIIVHRHEAEGSDPYGRGLGRVLFWHVLFKREGVGFWAHALEKFASPTPFAKYPYGTPPAEQDRLLNNLLGLVQRGALAVPIGTEVSFLEAAKSGTVDYEGWCRYWDSQTSIAVLGETLSTDIQGDGSRAATETHAEGSDRVADGDADMLSATLNPSLVTWIVEFNLPGANPPTVWRPRPKNEAKQEEAKSKKSDRVRKELNNLFDLAAKGFRPAEGLEPAISEIVGTDIVEDIGLLARFAPAKTVPSVRDRANGSTALTPDFAAHDHGVPDLVDQLEDAAQPVLDEWLAQIRAELGASVAAGETPAQFQARMLTLYPGLETDNLAEALAQGIALADLTGRADIMDEAGEE
ncbi:DUF935 family protein [Xanthobacter sp. VTT E-85241]|uniref:DUF935 domain-containing protein n=1 Tax=Roseixanthobacter finlandensis TaxID=3119922 RepID=UPI00372BE909